PVTPVFSPLSLHDALPISRRLSGPSRAAAERGAVGHRRYCDQLELYDPEPGAIDRLFSTALASGGRRGSVSGSGQNLREVPCRRDRKSTRLNSSHVKISYA